MKRGVVVLPFSVKTRHPQYCPNNDLCNIDGFCLYLLIFLYSIGLNSLNQGLPFNLNIRLMMVVLSLSFFSPFSGLRCVPDNLCKTAKLINALLCENFSAGWQQSRSDSSINAIPKGLGVWTELLESCDCTEKHKQHLKGFPASFLLFFFPFRKEYFATDAFIGLQFTLLATRYINWNNKYPCLCTLIMLENTI